MGVYYNEFDPFAAAWLRQLIAAGQIADGEVDERSITDISAADLKGFSQHHFFAGIGGWSRALRLAGWADDRPVWTGSCPCQPFSSAGNQKGKTDERHLWPIWQSLICECQPPVIFGEQVASAIAHGWLDDIYQGLEKEGYAIGAAVLPACGVGAPHKRDRLFFVAHADSRRWDAQSLSDTSSHIWENDFDVKQSGKDGYVADAQCKRSFSSAHAGIYCCKKGTGTWNVDAERCGATVTMANSESAECKQPRAEPNRSQSRSADDGSIVGNAQNLRLQGSWPEDNSQRWKTSERHADVSSGAFWAGSDWVECADGKARLIEPNICLLAHGVSNRVGKLRGYGNAIVPQVAAEFIKASSVKEI